MSGVLSFAPLDLVNLLFDLERLEIIELGLVRLEFRVEFVFAVLLLQEGKRATDSAMRSSPPAEGRTDGRR